MSNSKPIAEIGDTARERDLEIGGGAVATVGIGLLVVGLVAGHQSKGCPSN